MSDISEEYTGSDIVCPYCNGMIDNYFEYDLNEHFRTVECPNCDKFFECRVEIDYRYYVKKFNKFSDGD